MSGEQDFVDEMIEELTKKDPEFPILMEDARQRRALLHDLAATRIRTRISQKKLAKRIKTSQPASLLLHVWRQVALILAYQPYSAMQPA